MSRVSDCRVTVGYEHSGRGEDITDQINGEVIHIEMSDGTRVMVETFERQPGRLTIRIEGCMSSQMVVIPIASNTVQLSVEQRDQA